MNRNRKTKRILICVLVVAGVLLATGRNVNADFVFGEPENLGPAINTPSWERFPRVSADGLCLHFLRAPEYVGNAEVWMATRITKRDPWDTAVHLEWVNMAATYDAFPLLPGVTTADGLEFYFGANWLGGYGDSDLFVMVRETIDDPWGDPVNLGSVINTKYSELLPSISPDGLELYFSDYSEGGNNPPPGGYGGGDLWVAKRLTRNDPWQEPKNLGLQVNSGYQDARLHISSDGLLLFFDSQRPSGFGLGDIYMTRRTTLSDPWGEAVNLGQMVNTSAFEAQPNISSDGRTLFFVRVGSNGFGNEDIWQVAIDPVVDLNADGIVNTDDICIIVDHWGENYSLCDIGPTPFGDGIVDVQDLIVLAEHLFEEIPPVQ